MTYEPTQAPTPADCRTGTAGEGLASGPRLWADARRSRAPDISRSHDRVIGEMTTPTTQTPTPAAAPRDPAGRYQASLPLHELLDGVADVARHAAEDRELPARGGVEGRLGSSPPRVRAYRSAHGGGRAQATRPNLARGPEDGPGYARRSHAPAWRVAAASLVSRRRSVDPSGLAGRLSSSGTPRAQPSTTSRSRRGTPAPGPTRHGRCCRFRRRSSGAWHGSTRSGERDSRRLVKRGARRAQPLARLDRPLHIGDRRSAHRALVRRVGSPQRRPCRPADRRPVGARAEGSASARRQRGRPIPRSRRAAPDAPTAPAGCAEPARRRRCSVAHCAPTAAGTYDPVRLRGTSTTRSAAPATLSLCQAPFCNAMAASKTSAARPDYEPTRRSWQRRRAGHCPLSARTKRPSFRPIPTSTARSP